jgi:hypothetical protein
MMKLIIFLSFGFIALGEPQSADQPFCAVELEVTIPDGSAVALASAELLDGRGEVIKTAPVVDGKGKFCDFGFGSYTLRVDHRFLLPVAIYGIRLIYGETQHIRVILNESDLNRDGVGGGTACRAYLRFQELSLNERSIPNVNIISSMGTPGPKADAFGRARILVPLHKFTIFRFEKAGFEPKSVSLSCSEFLPDIERTIYMSPTEGEKRGTVK